MALRKDKRMIAFRTVILAVIILVVGGFAAARWSDKNQEANVAFPLAQCLTEKGAKFYGAYWCPHCAKQKKDFGSAMKTVTYVECAIPGNPQGQTQECKDAGVTSYPTWIFADGSRLGGVQTFEALAEKAGCPWGEAAAPAAAE
jgi:glutaredoxin